jgi:hypothetical protein
MLSGAKPTAADCYSLKTTKSRSLETLRIRWCFH